MSGPLSVALAHDTDVGGFRRAARALWCAGVPPEQVHWQVAAAPGDPACAGLFAPEPCSVDELLARLGDEGPALAPRVPAWYAELVDAAGCHRDTDRFERLYRLLWRLQREPGLRHDPLDPERVALERLARQVGREVHKMHAFVRFRPVAEAVDGDAALTRVLHLAWFEPLHHSVERAAPFFRRRFANLRWALLTPRRSVRWDGQVLAFGPGCRPEAPLPPDEGEALWLTYYRHTFNPARLNLAQMAREMPAHYRAQLPEGRLVATLAREAPERVGRMVEQAAPHRLEAVVLARRPVVRLAPTEGGGGGASGA